MCGAASRQPLLAKRDPLGVGAGLRTPKDTDAPLPLALPTLKENPAEAQIASHRLMLRAGLVRQTAAGIYAWLPAGWRVLQRIAQIVREEQDRDRRAGTADADHAVGRSLAQERPL